MTFEITIPVLNEADSLDVQIRKTLAFVEREIAPRIPTRLVISDNGSTDGTTAIAEMLVREFPDQVRLIKLSERGVGRALKASWGSSDADIVGYFDLDLATDLKHLHGVLDLLLADQADIVTGTRLARGSKVIGRSPVRAFTSRTFNGIVRLMFHNRFTDGMCGFKFLSRRHYETLLSHGAGSDGWIFATECLLVAEHIGLRVADLPVVWTDDPNSKAKIGKLAREYILALRSLKKRLKQQAPVT
ncbi:MAG: glycosyltransferase [Hyphomonas sp.]